MWIYKGDPTKTQGIPGVPTHDMSDEEFAAVEAAYDAQFPDQSGSLRRCGLYQRRTPKGRDGDGDN